MEAVLAAVAAAAITGGLSLAGTFVIHQKSMAVMQEQIKHLTKEVEKHNSVIERVYDLEVCCARQEEQITTLFKQQEAS